MKSKRSGARKCERCGQKVEIVSIDPIRLAPHGVYDRNTKTQTECVPAGSMSAMATAMKKAGLS